MKKFLFILLLIISCTNTDQRYCKQDSDCIFHCPKECINKEYFTEEIGICDIVPGNCKCIDNTCGFVPFHEETPVDEITAEQESKLGALNLNCETPLRMSSSTCEPLNVSVIQLSSDGVVV